MSQRCRAYQSLAFSFDHCMVSPNAAAAVNRRMPANAHRLSFDMRPLVVFRTVAAALIRAIGSPASPTVRGNHATARDAPGGFAPRFGLRADSDAAGDTAPPHATDAGGRRSRRAGIHEDSDR